MFGSQSFGSDSFSSVEYVLTDESFENFSTYDSQWIDRPLKRKIIALDQMHENEEALLMLMM